MPVRYCVDCRAEGPVCSGRALKLKDESSMARGSNKSSSRARTKGVSRRAQFVWASLVIAMTAVGGGLKFLMDRGLPTASADGLTPLMATSAPDSIEVVFNTPQALDKGRWQCI